MSGPLSIASGGLKAFSAYKAGKKAKKAAGFNAAVSEQQATEAEQSAAIEERRQRQLSKKIIGGARAQIGASGIAATGSALDVLSASAAAAEEDALLIRHQGKVQATALRNEAVLQRKQGSAAATAGYVSAASALANTGAEIYARRKQNNENA